MMEAYNLLIAFPIFPYIRLFQAVKHRPTNKQLVLRKAWLCLHTGFEAAWLHVQLDMTNLLLFMETAITLRLILPLKSIEYGVKGILYYT